MMTRVTTSEDYQKQRVGDDDDRVLTILTLPKMGLGDLEKSPAGGQEDEEEHWSVPDNITSSSTTDRWVEGSTGYSGVTALSEGGEEYKCSKEQSLIAKMTPLDNWVDDEAVFPVSTQASMNDDISTSLCSDRKDDVV